MGVWEANQWFACAAGSTWGLLRALGGGGGDGEGGDVSWRSGGRVVSL
jgi:hypothetical protein